MLRNSYLLLYSVWVHRSFVGYAVSAFRAVRRSLHPKPYAMLVGVVLAAGQEVGVVRQADGAGLHRLRWDSLNQ